MYYLVYNNVLFLLCPHIHSYNIVLLNCTYLFFLLTIREDGSILRIGMPILFFLDKIFSLSHVSSKMEMFVDVSAPCPTQAFSLPSTLPVLNTLCSLRNTMVAIDKTEVSIFWVPEPEVHNSCPLVSYYMYIFVSIVRILYLQRTKPKKD